MKKLIIIAMLLVPFASFADILTLTNDTWPATPIRIEILGPDGVNQCPVNGLNGTFWLKPKMTASFTIDRKLLDLGKIFHWELRAYYVNYKECCSFEIYDNFIYKTNYQFDYKYALMDNDTGFYYKIGKNGNNHTLNIRYTTSQFGKGFAKSDYGNTKNHKM